MAWSIKTAENCMRESVPVGGKNSVGLLGHNQIFIICKDTRSKLIILCGFIFNNCFMKILLLKTKKYL